MYRKQRNGNIRQLQKTWCCIGKELLPQHRIQSNNNIVHLHKTSLLCAPYLSQLPFIAGGMVIMGILYKTRQLFCSSAGKKIEVYVCKDQKHTWRMSSKTTTKLYTQNTTPEPLIEGSGPSLGHILLHRSLSLSGWGCLYSILLSLFSS